MSSTEPGLSSDFPDKPKKIWDEHPEMGGPVVSGKKRIEMLGFKSPRQGQKSAPTVQVLAAQHDATLPSKRDEAGTVLVRALATKRFLHNDPLKG